MAATWKTHRYLPTVDHLINPTAIDDPFEFNEAEIWNTNTNTLPDPIKTGRPIRKPARKNIGGADQVHVGARSLPVNVPDWSKILGSEHMNRTWECEDDDVEEYDGNDQMPPHEYLARTRVASLSVHEGVGRTLKGRDLSRVRNAIWKQTGFED